MGTLMVIIPIMAFQKDHIILLKRKWQKRIYKKAVSRMHSCFLLQKELDDMVRSIVFLPRVGLWESCSESLVAKKSTSVASGPEFDDPLTRCSGSWTLSRWKWRRLKSAEPVGNRWSSPLDKYWLGSCREKLPLCGISKSETRTTGKEKKTSVSFSLNFLKGSDYCDEVFVLITPDSAHDYRTLVFKPEIAASLETYTEAFSLFQNKRKTYDELVCVTDFSLMNCGKVEARKVDLWFVSRCQISVSNSTRPILWRKCVQGERNLLWRLSVSRHFVMDLNIKPIFRNDPLATKGVWC